VVGVLLFLLIVYGSTWALNLSLRTAAAAGSSGAAYIFLFGTVWAPTAAALVLTSILGGRTSRAQLLRRLLRAPADTRWFLAAAVVPFAAICLAVLAARALGDSAPRPGVSLWPSIIGMQMITGAVGEELGWRGFLLTNLSQRVGFTLAAILSALLWSAWHIAGAFFPGMGPQLAPLIPFLTFVAVFGVFLAFVFARTGHVLAPMLAHLSLNLTLAVAGIPLASRPFWWVLVLATATVVAAAHFTSWPANIAGAVGAGVIKSAAAQRER